MTPFEYVSVLISIILGLGITLVLTGVAELIRRWSTLTHFWPYLIWIALVFVLHVHEWWVMYELKTISSWSLPVFLFVILYPILLFILANLLFPTKWSKKGMDLRSFYFLTYPKFFLCAMALISVAVLSDLMITERTFTDQLVKIALLAVLLVLYLIRPVRVAVHGTIAILFLGIMIASLVIERDNLIIQ